DAEAERALLLQHAPCALALLSPAYLPTDRKRGERVASLADDACSNFSPLCARLPEQTAVFLPVENKVLAETVCRSTLDFFRQAHPDCRCGYALVGPEGLAAAAEKARAALWLALALDAPMQSAEWMYEQRTAHSRLQTMLGILNDAAAEGALPDEKRAMLTAMLLEFPEKARITAAISLLSGCDAEPSVCALSLGRLCGGDAVAEFADALNALFAPRPEDNISQLVRRSRDYLQLHFAEPVSLSALAEHFGVTPAYLSSLFHREIGQSYSQYLLQLRMEEAARQIAGDPAVKIQDVGRSVGFYSAKHFTHVFGQYFGRSPKKYREGKTPD
ncbi:MAG: AraC family transcriptional regulator, partial [Eubacteriales bacterium]|nr:AraC family transcriptional regulator [Eubacteriales bacterium]